MSETQPHELVDESNARPGSAVDQATVEASNRGSGLIRWLVWAFAVVVFAGYVLLARVHTRLGVEAPALDKDGREYVWRSWWRARHDIVDIGPDAGVTVAYAGLALAFLALSGLACWVALVPDDPTAQSTTQSGPIEP